MAARPFVYVAFVLMLSAIVPAEAAQPSGKGTPVTKPPAAAAPQTAAECAWIGKRIVGLLAREDVVAAGEFMRFYATFSCPEKHLGPAFACTIADGAGADSHAEVQERIDACWADPKTRFEEGPQGEPRS